jgi:hypothetical protein
LEDTPLPVADDNSRLLLVLIREDLKAQKLAACFNELGCTGNPYLADLTETVLEQAGFTERPNRLYAFYFNLLASYCPRLNGTDEVLMKTVTEIYEALIMKRKEF